MRSNTTLAVSISLLLGTAPLAHATYSVGDTIENFELSDRDGRTHALYDYRGKVIVLNFGEYWCPICNSEWEEMNTELWEPNRDRGAIILTIGTDDPAAFWEMERTYGGGWPWLFDEGAQVYESFGIDCVPSHMVLDQDFRLISSDCGWSGDFSQLQQEIDALVWDVQVAQIQPRELSVRPGDTAYLQVKLTNTLPVPYSFEAWIDAILPNHEPFSGNPIKARSLQLGGGQAAEALVEISVPPGIAPGDYRLRLGAGLYVDEPYSCDVMFISVK